MTYTSRDGAAAAIVSADGDEEEEEVHECCGGDAHKAELWDMTRPLEGNCKLELKTFDDPEGQVVRKTAAASFPCCNFSKDRSG